MKVGWRQELFFVVNVQFFFWEIFYSYGRGRLKILFLLYDIIFWIEEIKCQNVKIENVEGVQRSRDKSWRKSLVDFRVFGFRLFQMFGNFFVFGFMKYFKGYISFFYEVIFSWFLFLQNVVDFGGLFVIVWGIFLVQSFGGKQRVFFIIEVVNVSYLFFQCFLQLGWLSILFGFN